MSHWYNQYSQKCINVRNLAKHAVIKLMHEVAELYDER